MKERLYRLIGKMIIIIGMIMLLFVTTIVIIWAGHPNPLTIAEIYNDSSSFILLGFFPLGFILTCSGVIIRRRFREVNPFLTKDGEPIHSGKSWKRGSESGLFLTSCGLVVSINQESRATGHVGYKIVTANRATHRDCILKEGGAVLDNFAHGRIY